jgi:hypothetical protein
LGTVAHRSVSDVAFNANPATGQYLAVIPSGSATVDWGSAGGTSISAPQWAGLFAVANALRAQSGAAVLGDPHSILYSKIAAVAGTYASEFYDVTKGSDGSCATCSARVGYDQVTGLGTPNAANLLATLTGSTVTAPAPTPTPTPAPVAPVVTSASISGKAGTALSYTVTAKDANPLSYSLSGEPSGMTINSAGVLAWPKPAAGTYSVKVTAKDSKTGLSGQGVITIVIAPVSTTTTTAPVSGSGGSGLTISAASMNGKAGKALVGTIGITDPGVSGISITITGAPFGMMFALDGQSIAIDWPNPVAGTYTLLVSVVDSTGRHANSTILVTIAGS